MSYNPQTVQMVLHLRKPKTGKKIQWQEGVVDNEFLGRKRSKCIINQYIYIYTIFN